MGESDKSINKNETEVERRFSRSLGSICISALFSIAYVASFIALFLIFIPYALLITLSGGTPSAVIALVITVLTSFVLILLFTFGYLLTLKLGFRVLKIERNPRSIVKMIFFTLCAISLITTVAVVSETVRPTISRTTMISLGPISIPVSSPADTSVPNPTPIPQEPDDATNVTGPVDQNATAEEPTPDDPPMQDEQEQQAPQFSKWQLYFYFFLSSIATTAIICFGLSTVVLGYMQRARVQRGIAFLVFAVVWMGYKVNGVILSRGDVLLYTFDVTVYMLIGIILAWLFWKTRTPYFATIAAAYSAFLLEDFLETIALFGADALLDNNLITTEEFEEYLGIIATIFVVLAVFVIVFGSIYIKREVFAIGTGIRRYGGLVWLLFFVVVVVIQLVFGFFADSIGGFFVSGVLAIVVVVLVVTVAFSTRTDRGAAEISEELARGQTKEFVEEMLDRPIIQKARQFADFRPETERTIFGEAALVGVSSSLIYAIIVWVFTDFSKIIIETFTNYIIIMIIPTLLLGMSSATFTWAVRSPEFRPPNSTIRKVILIASGASLFMGVVAALTSLILLIWSVLTIVLLLVPFIALPFRKKITIYEAVNLLHTVHREFAWRILLQTAQRDETIDILKWMLKAGNPSSQINALLALSMMNYGKIEEELKEKIKSPDAYPREKVLSIIALGHLTTKKGNEEENLQYLREFLFDENIEIRKAAINALSLIKNEQSIQTLANVYLLENDESVKDEIFAGLRRVSPETAQNLL